MDTSRAGPVCDGVIVDAEVGGHALERVFVRFPFDKSETVEHGEDTDIDAVVLHISLRTQHRTRRGIRLGWQNVPP